MGPVVCFLLLKCESESIVVFFKDRSNVDGKVGGGRWD